MKNVLYPSSFNKIQQNYQTDTYFEFVTWQLAILVQMCAM
jgi:hypothetical protein